MKLHVQNCVCTSKSIDYGMQHIRTWRAPACSRQAQSSTSSGIGGAAAGGRPGKERRCELGSAGALLELLEAASLDEDAAAALAGALSTPSSWERPDVTPV